MTKQRKNQVVYEKDYIYSIDRLFIHNELLKGNVPLAGSSRSTEMWKNTFTLKLIKMRTVTLSTREFYSFKVLASFWFELSFKQGLVFITADADALAELGY